MASFRFAIVILLVSLFELQSTLAGNATALTALDDNAVIHYAGDTVYLGCVPSQSGKHITWYRNDVKLGSDDRHTVVEYSENSTLEIKYAGRDDLGTYVCKEEDTNKQGIAFLKSAPVVKNTKSINLNAGNTLNLECRGFGLPEPNVTWYRGDTKINEDGAKIKFKDTTYMLKGELIIENVEISDYGIYICEAENPHGSYNSTTLVRVKSKMRVIWPIIGIVVQLVILAIIIVVYERRKKQNQAKAE